MTVPVVLSGGLGLGGGPQVGVPDVLDLPQAEAEAKLSAFQLKSRVQPVEAEGAAGHVFAQRPEPRTIRPRGSVVTLLVIRAPAVPVDLGEKLDALQAAVDKLETDDAAEARKDEILAELGGGSPGPAGTGQ